MAQEESIVHNKKEQNIWVKKFIFKSFNGKYKKYFQFQRNLELLHYDDPHRSSQHKIIDPLKNTNYQNCQLLVLITQIPKSALVTACENIGIQRLLLRI